MTFEEYELEHLQSIGPEARRMVRMGWNARGSLGNCQQNLVSSDHFRDATKKSQGNLILAGDITDAFGMEVPKALVIQFGDDESLRAAIDSGQCRFTVFGGEV
ncbi:hypothetical protein GCM10011533_29980 [Streptosporangium jomthongense]|uniref:Uncharacterized protein n=1 Tax=Marinobacter aromaticivorans TaxID=1494078 RepID=A0ABW2IYZ3_9GAMM|nr:hypothetical protein [Marinobacter aromaticivorans]GGE75611.1 hypothetical protein GCM10011533_29980 [Streptosporangium jomthongense]